MDLEVLGGVLIMAWPRLTFGVAGTYLLFFPGVPADLERSRCLVTGGFGFAPRGERHVHCNHVVGAVHLIEVDG